MRKIVFERTAQVVVVADATAIAGQLITIPEINAVRPIAFELVDAAADLSVEVAVAAAGAGGQIELTAAALLPNSGARYFDLGPDDQIALESGAGATTADIRWFYPTGARYGIGTTPYIEHPRTQTATLSALVAEAAVTIPTGAVALQINGIAAGGAGNGLLYRVDDGTANGEQLPLLQGDEINTLHPFVIHVGDADRLRLERITADATVDAMWLFQV